MGDPVTDEVLLEFVDIALQFLDLPVAGLGDPPDEDGNAATILGKGGGDRLAQERAGQVGDFQATVDRIVVREGDELHSRASEASMEIAGIGNARGNPEAAEQPLGRPETVAGVEMKVGACHGSGNRSFMNGGTPQVEPLSIGDRPAACGGPPDTVENLSPDGRMIPVRGMKADAEQGAFLSAAKRRAFQPRLTAVRQRLRTLYTMLREGKLRPETQSVTHPIKVV